MSDFLHARRTRLAERLHLVDAVLLVGAGNPIPLPEGSDQTYRFRSHADYFYVANQECAGGVVAFDPRDGVWTSFVPTVTEGERVWEGKQPAVGATLDELTNWLGARKNRSVVQLGSHSFPIPSDEALTLRVRENFLHARRKKDAFEIALIRRAAAATAAGFKKIPSLLHAGVTERALQIELEAEFFRQGATRPGYGTIVGSGPNSAVLHFEPSARAAKSGEFILIDAGAEIDRYMADVTRTFVVGQPSGFQRDLYQIVLAAEERAIAGCRVGAEWKELHLATALQLTEGLVSLGLLRGNPSSLIEQEAHLLFFPHGLGHMVGLGVRDGSGLEQGRTKDPRAALKTLRMDLPLAAGYVVTIEPGLYFIPPLLNDPVRRKRFAQEVNWSLVDQHLELGGIRIEDNVLVTEGGPEILTAAIPKTLN